MIGTTSKIPRQKLSSRQKTKEWSKECVESFIKISNFSGNQSTDRYHDHKLYDYYNGVVEDEDYNHVLRPYGKKRSNFPAKLQNYNIIKPIVDVLLGEQSKRPLRYSVVADNPEAVSEQQEARKEMIFKNLMDRFAHELSQQGIGEEGEEPELPERVAERFDREYKDIRAIRGQKTLTYIQQKLDLDEKFRKAFQHFVISGKVVTERGVNANELFYNVLNPLDVDYDKDPDVDFIEDGDWAIVRKLCHASTLIDVYHEDLTDEQVNRLEDPQRHRSDNFLYYESTQENRVADDDRSRLIEELKVYWKSRRKIGFLTYIDEMGELVNEIVDETYKVQPGEMLEWVWINEVWEGTRIDGDMFVRMKPIDNQRRSIDNPSICKLPINGRKYSDMNSGNVSLVALAVPYQLSYNIFKYRLENSIAKSKDVIAQFDINMIPDKWDMDKWMYYVDATGIAWVDYAAEGISLNPQHQAVLDMSIKVIDQYIQLLESIVTELERVTGVSRQRQGDIGPYEGKGVTEQSIMQSSNITEDLFQKFRKQQQKDLQALLDYSKDAFREGKKGHYVLDDMSIASLDIDGEDHMESEYGVFVSDANKDVEKLEYLKQLGQSMIQNGTPASIITEIIEGENFTQVKDKIKKAERAVQELEQAHQEAEQQTAQAEREHEIEQWDREDTNKELDRQNKIEVALIQAESKEQPPEDTTSDDEELRHKQEESRKKLELERSKLEETKRSNKAKEKIASKKATSPSK